MRSNAPALLVASVLLAGCATRQAAMAEATPPAAVSDTETG